MTEPKGRVESSEIESQQPTDPAHDGLSAMSLPQIDNRECPDPCPGPCAGCPDRIVCRCLRVTEAVVVEAIVTLGLRTVKEVRTATGAGDGCTCCHRHIHAYLEVHAEVHSSSSENMLSAK